MFIEINVTIKPVNGGIKFVSITFISTFYFARIELTRKNVISVKRYE